MKMAVFWDVEPSSLVHTDQRFKEAYCLYQHPDTCRHENLKSHQAIYLINIFLSFTCIKFIIENTKAATIAIKSYSFAPVTREIE
jgi:hypothetical protein